MEGRGTAVRELQHVATPQSVATHMLHRPFWCPGARRLSFLATAPAAAEADAGAQREADGADDDDIPHDEVEAMFTSREVELVHQASSARVRARLTPLMEDVGAAGEGDSADGGDADSSLVVRSVLFEFDEPDGDEGELVNDDSPVSLSAAKANSVGEAGGAGADGQRRTVQVVGTGVDYFEAMDKARAQLEKRGLVPAINAAVLNVHASTLAREQYLGLIGYRLSFAARPELVETFAPAPVDAKLCSLRAQRAYYVAWRLRVPVAFAVVLGCYAATNSYYARTRPPPPMDESDA